MVTFTFIDSSYRDFKNLKSIFLKVLKHIEKYETCNILSVDVFFIPEEKIIKLNIDTFNHDYPTDIITLNYSNDKNIICELYLCPSVIEYNTKIYNVDIKHEILRVLIHGILHCLGYDDLTDEQLETMRFKENIYLSKCFT